MSSRKSLSVEMMTNFNQKKYLGIIKENRLASGNVWQIFISPTRVNVAKFQEIIVENQRSLANEKVNLRLKKG